MNNFLLSLMIKFIGADDTTTTRPDWVYSIIRPIINVLDSLLIPVIILLGVAGSIYAIVLGVQYAKAESADKREEAKKRLINAVIGVVIMLVALIAMKIFTNNAESIFGWINDSADPNKNN